MNPGWIGFVVVGLLVVLLFGRGKISGLMGEVASGITSFRKGMKEGDVAEKTVEPKVVADSRTIDGEAVNVSADTKEKVDS
ncbi:MAG: twin-arginine translocase TatA/TatE family subunit [Kordiimonadaceae bacterium]|nr:twin-arginine translocase TatA/TatE family subunit [Kordiimonadaceae bacterium]